MSRNLEQWLGYIEGLHPQTVALGLERIKIPAQKLNLLSFPCPVISVGGTNGKGSCVAFLEAILSAAGWRVASYTSPHLLRFQERARISGEEISDQAWCDAFTAIEQARGEIPLTYFEFTTLAALWLFQQVPLDAIILEVGLGGRLDAVNCIDADLAIIATIAMDHMDWLGETREAIAFEKAGIMRSGKPVVIGDYDPPAVLAEEAQRCAAISYLANRDFQMTVTGAYHWSWQSKDSSYNDLPIPDLPLQNAATVLMALHCLAKTLPVTRQDIEQGLVTARLPGRFQCLTTPIPTILDVAHNPASAQLLAKRLRVYPRNGRIRAVVAMLADKDISGSLQPLLPYIDSWHVASLSVARGAKAEILVKHLQKLTVVAYYSHNSVTDAYQQAVLASKEEDCILVFGSFHTVAEVLSQIKSDLLCELPS